jgi:hypothetical protein
VLLAKDIINPAEAQGTIGYLKIYTDILHSQGNLKKKLASILKPSS